MTTPRRARDARPEAGPALVDASTDVDLLGLLDLETIDQALYRATVVFDESWRLYGGQVAAQALRAAAHTVIPDRAPHSLHGYFLRPGDAARPTLFQVFDDRDGRSFSARRVVAKQRGEVIFSASVSFTTPGQGLDAQQPRAPEVPRPDDASPYTIPRLFSFEGRAVPQPQGEAEWPTRFWARCVQDLGDDPVLNACALTYLSDISTGLSAFDVDGHGSGASLDHAVWFHRPARLDQWVLTDYQPLTVGGGRGVYTGSFFDSSGVMVASMAQEALYRSG
jgi:acyl-CoA thioesterase II